MDFNGDGFGDVLVGASSADPNGLTDAGQDYVVYGRPSFGASLSLASLLATSGGDGSAGSVVNGFLAGQRIRPAGIGDVNGDGFSDLRFGAEFDDPNGLTDAGPGPSSSTARRPRRPPSSTWSTTLRLIEPTSTAPPVPAKKTIRSAAATRPLEVPPAPSAGDRIWVVDNNKKVYVYNPGGTLLGSWTAGSLPGNAAVEGHCYQRHRYLESSMPRVIRCTGTQEQRTRLSGSQKRGQQHQTSTRATRTPRTS